MVLEHNIKVGASYSAQSKVGTNDTAGALYSYGVLDMLFSTPALVSMMLEASIELLDSALPSDHLSVVTKCEVTHEHPTIFGEDVTVKVTVVKIEGNTVFLNMVANDESGKIGTGKIERVIISKNHLLEKAYTRIDKK